MRTRTEPSTISGGWRHPVRTDDDRQALQVVIRVVRLSAVRADLEALLEDDPITSGWRT